MNPGTLVASVQPSHVTIIVAISMLLVLIVILRGSRK